MPASALARIRYSDYLAGEQASEEKHEYCDGAVIAMSAGTPAHSRLKTNLTRVVGNALVGKPCASFDADLRVRVVATSLATYPDLTVICGPLVRDVEDHHAAVNPTALFEVLSPSTAGYDRGEKFDHYQRIETLSAYGIVDHTRPHLDLYTRDPSGGWLRRGYGRGDLVRIDAIDVAIAVDDVYVGWEELRE